MQYIEVVQKEEQLKLILLGAAAAIIAPKAIRIPHYACATIQNLYLDISHLGLLGTLKYRSDLTPSK